MTDYSQSTVSFQIKQLETELNCLLLERINHTLLLTLDSHVYQTNYIIAKEAPMATHFFAGANSPLAKRKNLSVHEVIQYPMILTEKGMGYRKVLDEKLAQLSMEVEPVLEIGRTDIITSILEDGKAVSFLPDFVALEKMKKGTLVQLDVCDFEADIWQQLIYHRNKWISKALDTFIVYVCEHEFRR